MAGVFRKTMVYLGLMEQGDEEYDEDFLESDLEPASVRRLGHDDRGRRFDAGRETAHGSLALRTEDRRYEEEVVRPMEPPTPSYRIRTFNPTNYNDARAIGMEYREGVPVIMNVSDMDERDAKRLVDFAAGLTFGLHGQLERVTARVFLLSPSNIEVSAEDKARIREGGFFNQS